MEDVEVDIAWVKTYANFEVIDIMGEKDPYPTWLRIEWTFDIYEIIDINKDLMTFEVEGVRVIQPLDQYLRPRFTKPTNGREEPELLD